MEELKAGESAIGFDFDFRPMGAEDSSTSSRARLAADSNLKVAPSMYGFKLDIPLDSEGDLNFPDEVLDDETIQRSVTCIGRVINSGKCAFTKLELTKKRIANIKRLGDYIYLRNINLADNRIRDLSPLAGIPFVQVLNVRGNRISDVSELPNLPFLQALNLSKNDITTTMGFQPNKLVYLNLSRNRLSSLEDFREEVFPNLLVLELRGNLLLSLEGLVVPSLEELYVAENQLLDVRGIEGCPKLRRLHARKNKISNLIDLSVFPRLEYLNLRNNQISDFSELKPLAGAVKLQTVVLSENPIAEDEGSYRPEVIAASAPSLRRVDKFLLSENEQAIALEIRMERSKKELRGSISSPSSSPGGSFHTLMPRVTSTLRAPSAANLRSAKSLSRTNKL